MAPAPRFVANSTPDPIRRLTNLHRHLSSSSHLRSVHPRRTAGESDRAVLVVESLPRGPEAPPPAETNTLPLWMTEQIAPGPTDSVYRSSQSHGPAQSDDTPGNLMAAIIVALVILGGLLGLFIGGEMSRRAKRANAAQAEHKPTGARWYQRRKHRAPQNTPESTREPAEERERSFAYEEKTLTPLDAAPVPRAGRDRRRRLSDVWPMQGLSALVQRFSVRLSPRAPLNQPPTVVRPVSPPPQMPTTWSGFSPIILSSPHSATKKFLERIPEEPDEDVRSQTRSEIAMTLGTALQRSIDSGSVLSVAPATRSKSLLSLHVESYTRVEKPNDAGENQPKSDEDSTYQEPKSLGNCVPDMTLDDSSADASLMSSQSIETEAENPNEVFELRRIQTRSMQINKGVLLSFSSKGHANGADNVGALPVLDNNRGTSTSPDAGEFMQLESNAGSQLTLGSLTPTYTMIILDDFPSPPSVLPEIPVDI